MSTRHQARASSVQPELPLGATSRRPVAPARPTRAGRRSPASPSGRSTLEDDGRLDEHTRAVGREGIAAARARLAGRAA